MNERELGQKLLELDAADLARPADPRQYTARILERDRRRGWWLTMGAVGLWSFATLLGLGVLVVLGLLFPMKAEIRSGNHLRNLNAAEAAQMERTVEEGMSMMLVLIALAVVVTAAAVLLTLVLVVSTRRATLRQVNANLLEICEQLRHLRGNDPPRAASTN